MARDFLQGHHIHYIQHTHYISVVLCFIWQGKQGENMVGGKTLVNGLKIGASQPSVLIF